MNPVGMDESAGNKPVPLVFLPDHIGVKDQFQHELLIIQGNNGYYYGGDSNK